ncbi:hypothetical protein GCM10022397_25230 [Flavivirga jejuensis]
MINFDSNREQYSQKFIDSLIVGSVANIDIPSFKRLLESDNNLHGWPYYYRLLSTNSLKNGQYDSVVFYCNKSIESYHKSENKREIDGRPLIRTYLNKGHALNELKNYKESIINYQKGYDLTKKYHFKWKSYLIKGIARNLSAIGNDSLALKYNIKASKDTVFMAVPRAAVATYMSIASYHEAKNDQITAKYYYKKALKASHMKHELYGEFKRNIPSIYGSLGSINFKENDIDSTLFYYKKAINASELYGIGTFKGAKENNLFYKSFVNVFEGPLEKGIQNLRRLIKDTKKMSQDKINQYDKDFMVRILQTLSIAYQKKGDSKEYSNLLNEGVNYLDKFHKMQLDENLEKLEIQYQTKEKDVSIAQLETSQKRQDIILKQQRIISYSLAGFLLLFLLLGYFFWKQRKLKAQYEKENLEQRLLRSQMNPHFVSNALNSICGLVQKGSDKTIPYINKLATLFRLTLENSREEFVSLNDEIIALSNYLEIQSNFSHDFDFDIVVEDVIDKEEVFIPPMLIQPFIENAILHGITNTDIRGYINIKIDLQYKNKLLTCRIDDNGIGYEKALNIKPNKSHKSLSVNIIGERLRIFKKKFKVNSRVSVEENKNKGTTIKLYLPYLIEQIS